MTLGWPRLRRARGAGSVAEVTWLKAVMIGQPPLFHRQIFVLKMTKDRFFLCRRKCAFWPHLIHMLTN